MNLISNRTTKNLILFIFFLTSAYSPAYGIPKVYDCVIWDFSDQSGTSREFIFNPNINAVPQGFEFNDISVKLYLSHDDNLAISLRSISNPQIVSSVTAFNLPSRIRTSLSNGFKDISFSAVLECKL